MDIDIKRTVIVASPVGVHREAPCHGPNAAAMSNCRGKKKHAIGSTHAFSYDRLPVSVMMLRILRTHDKDQKRDRHARGLRTERA